MAVRHLRSSARALATIQSRSALSAALQRPRQHPQTPAALHSISRATARGLSTETRAAITAAVGAAPVVLFMKGTPDLPQCGFSRACVQALALNGLDPAKFAAFNVLEDADLRQGVKEFSDWPTIPQLYVEKEFVGGCDIVMGMNQSGELGKMLEEKGLLVEGSAEEGEAKETEKKD